MRTVSTIVANTTSIVSEAEQARMKKEIAVNCTRACNPMHPVNDLVESNELVKKALDTNENCGRSDILGLSLSGKETGPIVKSPILMLDQALNSTSIIIVSIVDSGEQANISFSTAAIDLKLNDSITTKEDSQAPTSTMTILSPLNYVIGASINVPLDEKRRTPMQELKYTETDLEFIGISY